MRRDVNLSARDAFVITELAAALYMKQWPGRSRADVSLAEFVLYLEGQFDAKKKVEWMEKTKFLRELREKSRQGAEYLCRPAAPESSRHPFEIDRASEWDQPAAQQTKGAAERTPGLNVPVGVTDHLCRGGQYIYPDCAGCQGRQSASVRSFMPDPGGGNWVAVERKPDGTECRQDLGVPVVSGQYPTLRWPWPDEGEQ